MVDPVSVLQLSSHLNAGGRLLTPHDVRNKVLPTVRLREGYDLAEVDTFLSEIESTLRRLLRENARLSTRLTTADRASRQVSPSAGDSAARIVMRAQEAADEAIAAARQEADTIVAEARELAEAIEREALDKAAALERDSQEKHRRATETLDGAYVERQRRAEALHGLLHHHGSRMVETLEGHVGQLRNLFLELREQDDAMTCLPQPVGLGEPRRGHHQCHPPTDGQSHDDGNRDAEIASLSDSPDGDAQYGCDQYGQRPAQE
ncbi:DivIVA domain-containing protein [Streptosporangium subroseum]|uniref:Cell wall synthesis protein Wag31 n=2 Tax=Streptosporangium subroseum TaxID=106412 RepID=A0A239LX22_9ACTN|nr:DivIVA domain-containing protein [Streptosporangium subroseum]